MNLHIYIYTYNICIVCIYRWKKTCSAQASMNSQRPHTCCLVQGHKHVASRCLSTNPRLRKAPSPSSWAAMSSSRSLKGGGTRKSVVPSAFRWGPICGTFTRKRSEHRPVAWGARSWTVLHFCFVVSEVGIYPLQEHHPQGPQAGQHPGGRVLAQHHNVTGINVEHISAPTS